MQFIRLALLLSASLTFLQGVAACGSSDEKPQACDPPCNEAGCEACIDDECVYQCTGEEACDGEGNCVITSDDCEPPCNEAGCEACINGECVYQCTGQGGLEEPCYPDGSCDEPYICENGQCVEGVVPPTSTYHVETYGSDSNDGSESSPWLTLQHALNNISPGDTIKLGPGTFNERVSIPLSGYLGFPVTIEGTLGAEGEKLTRIFGAELVDPMTWELAPEIAPNVYKNTFDYIPHLMLINDQHIASVGEGRSGVVVGQEYNWETFYHYPEEQLVNAGGWTRVPVSFWETMGAVYSSDDDGTTYLRIVGGENPADYDIHIAPLVGHLGVPGNAAINIHNQHSILIKDLSVGGADTGILVTGRRASTPEELPRDIVIDNCFIEHGRRRIHVTQGANDVTIKNCHLISNYTVLGLGNNQGPWMLGINSEHAELYSKRGWWYEFMKACHGPIGITNDNGVRVDIGAKNVKIEDCHIDAGGIGVVTENATGVIVTRSLIENQSSVGIAPLAGSEIVLYDNVLKHNSINCRLHRINDPDLSRFYKATLYRNLLINPLDVGMQITFFAMALGPEVPYNEPEMLIYHNTMLGGMSAFSMPITPKDLPGLFILNNIFDSDWALRGSRFDEKTVGICENNWFGGARAINPDWPEWTGGDNIVQQGVRIWTEEPFDGVLPVGHIAREAGRDLSQPFVVDGKTYGPFEGMESGYFTGSQPDIGFKQHED